MTQICSRARLAQSLEAVVAIVFWRLLHDSVATALPGKVHGATLRDVGTTH